MGNKARELSWTAGSEGLWVGTRAPLPLPPPLCPPPHETNQEPLGSFPNRCPTTTWAGRDPRKTEEGRRGREPCGGHHCGNVVNCAFLRPWESHTRAGTCRHGKGGLLPSGERMSAAEKHDLITWQGGASSDALSLLCN